MSAISYISNKTQFGLLKWSPGQLKFKSGGQYDHQRN
jgi:hypothetical protein